MEFDNKEDAVKKEIEFILLYGRKDLGTGTLVNMTNGGEANFEISDECRKAISERMKGNKNGTNQVFSEERRRAISERTKGRESSFKGKSHSEKTKDVMSLAKRGIPHSQKHRNNLFGSKPNEKKIICMDTGNEYKSIGECIRLMFGCKSIASSKEYRNIKHGISKVCNGKRKKFKSLTFKFI